MIGYTFTFLNQSEFEAEFPEYDNGTWAFDIGIPIILTPTVFDDDDTVITPAVYSTLYHVNIRCMDDADLTGREGYTGHVKDGVVYGSPETAQRVFA